MPFREKMKKAFGRPTSSPAPTILTTVPSTTSSKKSKKSKKTEDYENWPENIYKPYEMPRPKYKGIVDKKHTDRLEAFSFGSALEAMRRRSGQSQYSPMGSRLPSRGPSRSGQSREGERMGYGVGREPMEGRKADDDDGGNVNLSKRQTREAVAAEEENGDGEGLEASMAGQGGGLSRTMTNGNELEAGRMITDGQVNGHGNRNGQVNGHAGGHANGFREVPWGEEVSAALARTET